MNATLTRRILAAAGVVSLAAVSLTACSAMQREFGEAWAITYEVSTSSASPDTLTSVHYVGAEKRGQEPRAVDVQSARTTVEGGKPRWSHEVLVLTNGKATVRATPSAGQEATCRILLDGKTVLAEQHAEAGKTVSCSTTVHGSTTVHRH